MAIINKEYFEYSLIGTGSKTIVFFNGFRMKFDTWDKVFTNIPENNKIILFNRLGVGSSSKATKKQTGSVVVNEIHRFLTNLEIQPPYLLVAHSLGGIYANLYARTFPNDVSGIVFVDAPHPSEILEQRKFKPPMILQVLLNGIKKFEKLFDKYRYSEDECIEETILQIQNANPFPNIPVTVITGTKKMPFVPQEAFKTHLHYQNKLLILSEYSRQYKCNESGHFPQITEPEIVVNAIIEITQKISNKSLERNI